MGGMGIDLGVSVGLTAVDLFCIGDLQTSDRSFRRCPISEKQHNRAFAPPKVLRVAWAMKLLSSQKPLGALWSGNFRIHDPR
ncbi:hypothetical protein CU669_17550 [Paramagnetospirillum kuznetsovii]|uniref:Uncharacterized protein n=1 Tax=Paramagnetospirillum kuznetsovii TaxID=2053833 RepID=A0A364NUP9_9PROT|nr:hypothetical protein CU669_17550 [Paramagnetospirillum kuznetsovii]